MSVYDDGRSDGRHDHARDGAGTGDEEFDYISAYVDNPSHPAQDQGEPEYSLR